MLSFLRPAHPVARALGRRPSRHAHRPGFDRLDDRLMLTASGGFTVGVPRAIENSPFPASVVEFSVDAPIDLSNAVTYATPNSHVIAHGAGADPLATSPLYSGLNPAQVARAYGFDRIAMPGGIKGDGTGQTIVLLNAFDNPNIVNDLHQFNLAFGLPDPPSFTIYKQKIGTSPPTTNSAWAAEIALDVQWAHAMAPGAHIILAEAYDNLTTNLFATAKLMAAQPGVSVISMSFGSDEFSYQSIVGTDTFATPTGHGGVTFIASSGDDARISYPASSPRVLGIGGTTLNVDASGNYLSESGWGGSGGGISAYEARPGYQDGIVSGAFRQSPDVSYNANPFTGFAVYDSFNYGASPWVQYGGTSAGAPQWASLIAIANQARALNGLPSLDGPSQTLPMLYQLRDTAFRDIYAGSAGTKAAGMGYDLVTGIGTPRADLVVAGLSGTPVVTPPATEVVVDRGQLGYAESGSWLSWGIGLGGSLRYRAGGDATVWASWTASGLAGGTYDVQADWNAAGHHASNARYTVLVDGAIVGTYLVDQRYDSSGGPAAGDLAFQTIARAEVPQGGTLTLILWADGNGEVVADAARFAPSTTEASLGWSGDGLSGAPTSVAPGAPFSVDRAYKISGAALPAGFAIAYYATTSPTFDRANATLLATETIAAGASPGVYAGSSPLLTLPWVGAYYLFAVIVPGGVISESPEADNISSPAGPIAVLAPVVEPPASATVVVDRGDSGYAESGSWLSWGIGLGGSLRYRAGGDAAAWASWTASNLGGGTYDVQADWNRGWAHASNARYTVYVNGSAVGSYVADHRVDSSGGPAAGDLWFQTIARVVVPQGGTLTLVLWADGDGEVVADAARFAPVGA